VRGVKPVIWVIAALFTPKIVYVGASSVTQPVGSESNC
jgi:hypothetical protein